MSVRAGVVWVIGSILILTACEHPIFLWQSELKYPLYRHGNIVRQKFSHVNDQGIIELDYHAEHADDILSIADAKLKNLACFGKWIQIEFEQGERSMRELKAGKILVGGPEQLCHVPEKEHSDTIMRRITEIVWTSDRIVEVDTEYLGFEDVFHNAKVSFKVSKFNSDVDSHEAVGNSRFDTLQAAGGLNEDEADKLIEKGAASLFGRASQFGEKVKNMAAGLLGNIQVGGVTFNRSEKSLQYAKDVLTFNYDAAKKGAAKSLPLHKTSKIACDNCYSKLTATVTFILEIVERQVKSFEFTCAGDFESGIGFALNGLGASWNLRTQPDALSLKPVAFFVGPIPVRLNLSMGATVGIQAEIKTSEKFISANASFGSKISFGVKFSPDKKWSVVKSVNPRASGGVQKLSPFVVAAIKVDVFPTVAIGVSQVGYIGLGLSNFVEVNAFYTPNETSCTSPTSMDWGAMYNVVYGVGFNIFNQRIGFDGKVDPTQLVRKNIISGCLKASNDPTNTKFVGVQPAFVLGRNWFGPISLNVKKSPKCILLDNGNFGASLIRKFSENDVLMAVTFNLDFVDSDYCAVRHYYRVKIDADGTTLWSPFNDVDYEYEECNAKDVITAKSWKGTVTADRKKWTLVDVPDECWFFTIDDDPNT